jgi:hypothetical protein
VKCWFDGNEKVEVGERLESLWGQYGSDGIPEDFLAALGPISLGTRVPYSVDLMQHPGLFGRRRGILIACVISLLSDLLYWANAKRG